LGLAMPEDILEQMSYYVKRKLRCRVKPEPRKNPLLKKEERDCLLHFSSIAI
jgi:hypothetical protein